MVTCVYAVIYNACIDVIAIESKRGNVSVHERFLSVRKGGKKSYTSFSKENESAERLKETDFLKFPRFLNFAIFKFRRKDDS